MRVECSFLLIRDEQKLMAIEQLWQVTNFAPSLEMGQAGNPAMHHIHSAHALMYNGKVQQRSLDFLSSNFQVTANSYLKIAS